MAILVAFDGSQPAQHALEHAITEYADEEIVLLRVVEAAPGSFEAGIELIQEKLRALREEPRAEIADELLDLIAEKDLDFRTELVAGDPAREIVEFTEENDIDHIIIGNHGRDGVSRVLLGSVAEKVVRRSPTTVTVVR